MKTIVALLAIGATGWVFWHLNQEDKEGIAASQAHGIRMADTAEAMSTPAGPFVPSKLSPRDLSDLFLIRGVVVKVSTDGVLIQCEAVIHPNVEGMVTAETGAADAAAIARWAAGDNDGRYGQPIQVVNGRWHSADIIPSQNAVGFVLLTGIPNYGPIEIGKRFKIVAAPTGDFYDGARVYSAQFPLTERASKAWMWGTAGP